MAKPKLCLIPSSQGSKLYSVLPSSGVGDFDFTRSGGATRINSQGLIETVADGVSRLNYPLIDGKVVGCPSHLLEPQRTNLIQYSEDFTDSSWFFDDATLISNSVISPDGTQNASTLIGNTVNSRHHIASSVGNAFADGSYTVFAKAKELRYLQITSVNTTQQYVNFDLLNGVFVLGSDFSNAKMEDYGNGWYKCTVVSDDEYNGYYLSLVSELNATWLESWVMPNNTDGLYIWGAQLEQGSYPTSYIKSNGSATTRSAETANNSGDASTFNDSEGVLMAELLWTATSSNIYISIDDNTSNNRILIYSNSTDDIKALVGSGGSTQVAFTATNQDPTTFSKVAIKYKENDFALWINGIKLLTDTVGSTPIGLSNCGFRAGGGTTPFNGSAKQIQYYDTALTDSELETLTSWVSFTDMAESQLYSIE